MNDETQSKVNTPRKHIRIVRRSVDSEIERLRRYMGRMEFRYELKSENLEKAVDDGIIRETAEVGRWLIALHTLRMLECRGTAAGSHTSASS